MNAAAQIDPPIDPDVAARLRAARAVYLRRDYAGAKKLDQQALELATQRGCAYGKARATRYLGLCAYRLLDPIDSVDLLRDAREQAQALKWTSEVALTCNHLGASLRKAGDVGQAQKALHDGLGEARGGEMVLERARLLGSLGALYDDLGDLEGAADAYARYQELLQLTNDTSRLANAAGLNSRVLRLRGRYRPALDWAQEELRLGHQVGDPLREGRGWMHQAEARLALGQAEHAEQAFGEAERLIDTCGDQRAALELFQARARAALEMGALLDADRYAARAQDLLDDTGAAREAELRGRLCEIRARTSSALGLHGEALWHLGKALEAHLSRLGTLRSSGASDLLRFRRKELGALAREIKREEGSVDRDSDEHARIEHLLAKLQEVGPEVTEVPVEHADAPTWSRELRSASQDRWGRILPGYDAALLDASALDLVLSDMLSHGLVADLSRSILLLLTALERELFDKVFSPLRALGNVAVGVERCREVFDEHRAPPTLGRMRDFVEKHELRFPEDQHQLAQAYASCRRALPILKQQAVCLDGSEATTPLDLRNAIAHGRDTPLKRLEADAVRRMLTLHDEAPLRALVSAA